MSHPRKSWSTWRRTLPGSTTPRCGDPASAARPSSLSFVHFAHTAERGLFDFLFLAEGCGCASTGARSTTSTWSAGRTRSPC